MSKTSLRETMPSCACEVPRPNAVIVWRCMECRGVISGSVPDTLRTPPELACEREEPHDRETGYYDGYAP